MVYELAKAGRFRANPAASTHNLVRFIDENNPGTPATDTVTDYESAAATEIQGVRYTGKDGVSQYIPFFVEERPTAEKIAVTVPVTASAADIQAAIHRVVGLHEVDPVVTVSKTGTLISVVHTGSGSLTDLVVDGADVDLSRAAISGVSTQDEPAELAVAGDLADDDTKKGSKKGSKK